MSELVLIVSALCISSGSRPLDVIRKCRKYYYFTAYEFTYEIKEFQGVNPGSRTPCAACKSLGAESGSP